MGIFSGINTARPSDGGVYLGPGAFLLKVIALKQGRSRKKKDFFVAEFEILESTNKEFPVGSTASWMVTIDRDDEDTIDMRLGDIKKFCSVLSRAPLSEVDEAAVEMLTSAANPAADWLVRGSGTNKKTRAGGDFTKFVWMPVDAAQAA